MNFRFLIFLVFFTLFLFSCERTQNHVILTFDDSYVDEWFAQRELFNKYKIKVTFFISRPYRLSQEQIDKLNILAADGHEVGCHGMNHILATEENQYQYIENEIVPALKLMSGFGFSVTSFAYPFGQSTPFLDSVLSNYFTFVRKATYNYLDTLISTYPEIYVQKSNFCNTNTMGVDFNYNISLDNLEDALVKAKKTGSYLALHAHAINESDEDYSISPKYLEDFFIRMKKHKVGGETCREIVIRSSIVQ